jgi:hypothetical protein
MELLAARGLKDWENADEELREARKQARTEAKKEFLKAAEETPLKTIKAFVEVEGIGDVEHAKAWTPEQKRTACHKVVELRHELSNAFGALVTLDPSGAYYMGRGRSNPGVDLHESPHHHNTDT